MGAGDIWMKFCQIHTHYSYGQGEMIDLQRGTQCTEPAPHRLWQTQLSGHMLEHVYTSQSHKHVSFPPSQAFAIPGQYAFAHQDVSMLFWVTSVLSTCSCPLLLSYLYILCAPYLQRSNTGLLTWLTLRNSSSMHWLKWKGSSWDVMISCSSVARDMSVFSDDWKEVTFFHMTPSVMFVNVWLALYCSFQILWNNSDWLVSSNFLPTLQLTKLHQLAMQHIPLPSLGQSNPTFPGTYPRLPGEVHLSSCLHSSLESHHLNTPATTERISLLSLRVYRLSQVFYNQCPTALQLFVP